MENEVNKKELIEYIEKASVAILGLLFLFFPVFFTNITTDFFIIPKQALIIFAVSILILLFGVKTLLLEKVRIRRTPFDLPVLLFIGALILSTIFSSSKADSAINLIPAIFAGLSFFAISYNVRNEKSLMVLFGSLLGGGALLAAVAILTYLKIYIFPFDFAKAATFTPAGSLFDQTLYLLLVLPVGLLFLTPLFSKKLSLASLMENRKATARTLALGALSIFILAGFIVSIYNLIQLKAAVLLPMETGFQTAFASISQDSGRVFQGFLFGSGYGEYLLDFTKFKQAVFNLNPQLWNLTFVRSSSFVLELLATTGILGILSFLYLIIKVVREKPLFLPLILILGASFIVPFSYFHFVLIFFILGLYVGLRGLSDEAKYFDVELHLLAFKKGLLAFASTGSRTATGYHKALSYVIFAVIVIFVATFGFITFDFLSANINFEKSLLSANQNNGQLTYNYQSSALGSVTGRFVDSYYRIFSQTNLSLANALASSVPKGTTPSQQTTQTVYSLVQQSINAGRQATTLSPNNTLDWQNLAAIYRALIGFGQNADSFSILAQQQAVTLDPSNPQEYITLGGIYFQLQNWSKAQEEFQLAINLKSDFPNAYYNLGHVLEQTGDLKGALAQFETVRTLVANNPTNVAQINQEINALNAQINQQSAQTTQTQTANPQALTTPSAQTLPKQNPPVKIPAPQSQTTTPTPTGGPTPTSSAH